MPDTTLAILSDRSGPHAPTQSKRWALNRFDDEPSSLLRAAGVPLFAGIPMERNAQVPESSRNTMHLLPIQDFLSNGHNLSVIDCILLSPGLPAVAGYRGLP